MPILFVACTRAHPVSYGGSTQQPRVSTDAIAIYEVQPDGLDVLGQASVECERQPRSEPIRDERWVDVVCSRFILEQALKARAAEVGGTGMVPEECQVVVEEDGAAQGTCSALIVSEAGASVSNARPRYASRHNDEPLLAHIDITPTIPSGTLAPLSIDWAQEIPIRRPGQTKVASVVARCETCSLVGMEKAIRSVAPVLGAPFVASLHCTSTTEGWLCMGDAVAYDSALDLRH